VVSAQAHLTIFNMQVFCVVFAIEVAMTPYAPTERARSPRSARIASIVVAAAAVMAASVVPAGAAAYAITPGGPQVVVTVASSGGTSRATFVGSAGQRVSVRATNTSILAGNITLQGSSGNMLRTSGLNGGGAYLDMVTLPADDTYAIVVDPSGTHTGSTTLTLYDVPNDPVAAATSGNPATVTTTVPGQNAQVTFSGTAGWDLSLRLTNVSTPILNILVKNPDGTTLMPALGAVGAKWIEPLSLTQTGTYTIKLDPQSFAKGSETLTAWTFHGDQTANIAADGSSHTFNLATPGQNGSMYLTGSNGDRVSFTFTGITVPAGKMWVKNPDGTVLVPSQSLAGSGIMIEPLVLGQNGVYHIFLNPDTFNTGAVTVHAYTVPPDIVADVAADGTPDSVPFTIPGQNARLRFNGTAGENVSLKLASSVADTDYQILKPNGNVLDSGSFATSGAFIDPITLPVDGTYKVVLDPQSFWLGTVTATLYDVPADVTVAGALSATSTVTVGTPGQNAAVTFAGTAGQRVSVTASGVTISSSTVWLRRPDGSTLGNPISVGTSGGFLSPVTLPSNGTYSVAIDPWGAGTGDMSVHLDVVPGDAAFTIAADGVPVSAFNSDAGQNMQLTFTGTANKKVSLVISNVTLGAGGTNVRITKPDGSTLISSFSVGPSGGYVDTFTLPANGTYAIRVDPQGTAIGSADFTLYTVPANASGTITPNGPTAAIATTAPGQSAKLTFTGQTGWTIVLKMEPTTCCATQVSITAPNGSTKLAPTLFSNSGQVSVPLTLGGTYTITVDPQGSGFGTHRVTLTH
jgi:hypothetical protein